MASRQPEDRGEVILYRTEDGRAALDVRLVGETVWLTQAQIADLFAVNVPAISKHIKNIYTDRELARKTTISKMETVRTEGKRRVARTVELYNLDMIISVGYRVNFARATRFRIWATQTLKHHLIRGYTLNERRLRESGLSEAEQAIQLLSRTLTRHELVNEESRQIQSGHLLNSSGAGNALAQAAGNRRALSALCRWQTRLPTERLRRPAWIRISARSAGRPRA